MDSTVSSDTDCAVLYGNGLSPGPSCTSTYWVTAVNVWGDESASTNWATINTATCFATRTSATGGTEGNTPPPLPTKTLLEGSYPNPFNPTCVIRYALSADAQVSLKVFNVFGQEVITLVDEFQPASFRSVTFDARTLASGVYFYRLRAGNFVDVKKMVFTK
ncbi:MAG: T9SS type A sorting domain-containing protein [Ignavibacteria bacterium]|nr:MAG: T9SS type A sorting domain-containing protein [Ignavibacteria bacterium]